ncbi:MAG: hypothetical protein RL264_2447 [Bacteroidota bacterium]|jgi:3-oxoacyl-[acyl-carrier protein] reductase
MRKIVITGASGGIGQALAEDLLRKGHFLYLVGNKNISRLDGLQKTFPGKLVLLPFDFDHDFDLEDLVQHLVDVDTVIHAMGVSSAGMSWKIAESIWERSLRLNLTIPFKITQRLIPSMRQEKFGRIIFFSSVVAQKGIVGTSAYSASKSALIGLTRTLAAELATSNITVNCIAPGYMDVGMIHEVSPEFLENVVESIPMKQLGDVKNICKTVNYLIDEKTDYVTGQVLNVNGGMI